jgi:hypothetical protein
MSELLSNIPAIIYALTVAFVIYVIYTVATDKEKDS